MRAEFSFCTRPIPLRRLQTFCLRILQTGLFHDKLKKDFQRVLSQLHMSVKLLCCFPGGGVASIVALLSGYAQREHQAYIIPAHRGVIDPNTDIEPLHSHSAIQNFSYRFLRSSSSLQCQRSVLKCLHMHLVSC